MFRSFKERIVRTPCICVASSRVSTIKKFPADMMDTLRTMIIQEPHHFLMLSRTKQELLVDKMVQRLVSSGTFTKFINSRKSSD